MSGNKRYIIVAAMLLVFSILVACAGCLNVAFKDEVSETTTETSSRRPELIVSDHSYVEPDRTYVRWSTDTPTPTNTPVPVTATPTPVITRIPYNGAYGSAGTLEGRTVVVSIFINDATTSWEGVDAFEITTLRRQLKNACSWLSRQAEAYGKSSEFFCDWQQYPELCIWVETGADGINQPSVFPQIIDSYVDSNALRNEFLAEDIVYIFYFNTPEDSVERSNAFSYTPGYEMPVNGYEFVRLYRYIDGIHTEPNVFAHEILHLFGCPDLYCSSSIIPQAYVNYLEENGSNDVMFYSLASHSINERFSDLDAYYTGLIDDCEEIHTWNLGPCDRYG